MRIAKILVIAGTACLSAIVIYIACSHFVQETVWVIKDGYDAQLQCDIPASATVGEWVTLNASRSPEAWKRVRKADLKDGQFSLPSEPLGYTEYVAPHLQWQTEPQTAEIRKPSFETLDVDMKFRQIRFLEPGDYQIRAISHWPYEYTTSWMPITVLPNTTEPSHAPEPAAAPVSNRDSSPPAR